MATGTEKIVQYLSEAHATELALVRTLQAHVAMTPRGDYRKLLERHLRETRTHATRLEKRLEQLGAARTIVQAGADVLQGIVGQIAALGKAPMDIVRGETGEEKLLKNAKDECATEALEIATYDVLEALATAVGDTKTAELAASNRADEVQMLADLRALLPELTGVAARAEVSARSFDVGTIGATAAARGAQQEAMTAARTALERAEEAVRDARSSVRGNARTQLELAEKGLRASRERLEGLISGARSRVSGSTRGAGGARSRSPRSRGAARNGTQPWPGYDGHTAADIQKRLTKADAATARKVLTYERSHKKRKTIVEAAQGKTS